MTTQSTTDGGTAMRYMLLICADGDVEGPIDAER